MGFSPRVWGCTEYGILFYFCMPVFPTCVGVYRYEIDLKDFKASFPHVCGGVPMNEEIAEIRK